MRIGPPNVNPNWFCLSSLVGGWTAVKEKLDASTEEFLKNSNSAPWNEFVPGLVETLIWPVARPNSAGKTPVWTLNSWIASIEGRKIYELKVMSVLLTPSRVK